MPIEVVRATPGSSGVTLGAPVVVDPTDATRVVSTDKLGSGISTSLIGVAAGNVTDGNVLVAVSGLVGGVPTAIAVGSRCWAVHGGNGFTTTNPGGSSSNSLYLGFIVSRGTIALDLPHVRNVPGIGTPIGGAFEYGGWIALSPSFSNGNASSMPNNATATADIDVSTLNVRSIELSWNYTNGASAPTNPVSVSVARDVDDTNWETTPAWSFTEPDAAGATIRAKRVVSGVNRCRVVLTNSTGQAISNVAMRYRTIRG